MANSTYAALIFHLEPNLLLISHIDFKEESIIEVELFGHFTKTDHYRLLEDISVKIIDRVFRDPKQREGYWQFKLEGF